MNKRAFSTQMARSLSYFKKGAKGDIILEVILLVIAIISLLPIYYMVNTTLRTPDQVITSPFGFPEQLDLSGYVRAWNMMNYPNVFKNNLIISLVSVSGVILLSSMAAYTFARRPGKVFNWIFITILIGVIMPFQVATIQLFRVLTYLHLTDTLLGVILVEIFVAVPFNVFLIKNFVNSVPIQLEESAFIDGAGVWRTYWRITFPLLQPVIATLTVLDSLSVWNDFFTPLLILHSRAKGVILLEVYRNVGQFQTDWTNFFPMMILGVAPLVILYLFMQKYIVEGVSTGAVKG
ncbi:carbohydrate ABC transporter permease [Paenibacillus alginolyticus]|uniref:carbohydrate ABC transporter permease n=1 Tax=Paenibacillus alginolyticus TaxID=59839 RepID=UPI001FE4955F|nr:carbohydrate ABC transporter permease [Paenibacillus frigoriresistens]